MRTRSLLASAAFCILLAACNRPRPAEVANEEVAPRPDAGKQAKVAAQAHAEKQFDSYRERMEKEIEGLDQRIQTLESSAKNAAASTKKQIYKELAALCDEREVVHNKVQELRRSGVEKWQAVKPALEKTLGDLQTSLKTAQANIEKAVDQAKDGDAFSKSRQEFEQFQLKMQKVIENLDAKIDGLLAGADKAANDTKAQIYSQLSGIYEQRDAVRQHMNKLHDAGIQGWQELRGGVEQAIQNLGDAVTRAGDKFKS